MKTKPTSLFALMALALIVPIIATALAAPPGPTVRYYSATINPTSVIAGNTESYTITITNVEGLTTSSQTIKSATVAIPAEFTDVLITSHSPDVWSANIVSGVIQLAKTDSTAISPGASLSVTFTATAPTPPGPYTFYTYAYNGADFSTQYNLDGEQPVVTVIAASVPEEETCYNYETAFACGGTNANDFRDNGFSRWGWTNGPLYNGYSGTWELWAGAGQSNLENGVQVGTVDVIYSGGTVAVAFNMNQGIVLQESSVYAGNAMFPLGPSGKATVAPGQYTNPGGFTGEVYVIIHAVVGIPAS